MFFSSHCCRVLSLTGNHSSPHLPRMPPNTVLISRPAGRQLRFSSGPTPMCSCLQCPQLTELVYFLLWELSMAFYIFHRHRVCLVDRVDLFCNLYNWWEFWVFFLSHTAPEFQLWFYFHFYMWVVHWGLLLRLPWRSWVCFCEG